MSLWFPICLSCLPPLFFFSFQQIVGVVLAAIILGEILTALQYVSIVLIIGGLFLVVWAQYQEETLKKMEQNQDEDNGEADSLQELFDDAGSVEGDQLQLLSVEENTSQNTLLNSGLVFTNHVLLAELDEEDEL